MLSVAMVDWLVTLGSWASRQKPQQETNGFERLNCRDASGPRAGRLPFDGAAAAGPCGPFLVGLEVVLVVAAASSAARRTVRPQAGPLPSTRTAIVRPNGWAADGSVDEASHPSTRRSPIG